jgi:formate dehydrogenase iron-sulfur subunit
MNNTCAVKANRVFVSLDTSALSKGSEAVAQCIQQHLSKQPKMDVTLVRNGTRGMVWLEPLVEFETAQGRIAYGPVKPEDVADIFQQQPFYGVSNHPLCLGLTDNLPWMKKQQRLTFARV